MVHGFLIYTGPNGYHVGLWLYSGSVGAEDSRIKLFFLITHPNNDRFPSSYSNTVKLALGYPQSSKKSIFKTLYLDFQDTTFTVFWKNVDGAILGDTHCYTSVYM